MANRPTKQTCKFVYDFAVDGGSHSASNQGLTGNGAGVITPADADITIPENAIITDCITYVTTAMTSGGSATVAIGCGGAALVAATAFDNGVFDDEDVTHTVVADKTTAAGRPTITVATAALTAGVVEVIIEYYQATTLGA
jgi:hypothetical protein|tara:strand:+ start:145 stop:567 length:423 start_codon:yes stop_codon:yes gene_type:complete